MIPQQQNNTHTHPGRHRVLMTDLRRLLGARLPGAKILSFGCSTGLECLDLAEVMPEAAIYGCEIKDSIREQAVQNCGSRARILPSEADVLAQEGPFDAILALNVLCLYPKTAGLDDVTPLYPFSRFDAAVAQLDQVLAPGGFLVIYNGQYFLEDTSVAGNYLPVEDVVRPLNGWIEKSLPSGERATDVIFEYEGKRFNRTEWADFSRIPEIKAHFPQVLELRTYQHTWRQPGLAENRSTTRPIWKKSELL